TSMLRSLMHNDGMKLIVNENEISELYDLKIDPGETTNLYKDPKYRETLESMVKEIDSINLLYH
ncbi:MAG: DUF4976 domain-containing protein, partial [Bacteroidetes bacterium]|nr:DUF4976 domain-containing protein [Bacteroidota bacterium]